MGPRNTLTWFLSQLRDVVCRVSISFALMAGFMSTAQASSQQLFR